VKTEASITTERARRAPRAKPSTSRRGRWRGAACGHLREHADDQAADRGGVRSPLPVRMSPSGTTPSSRLAGCPRDPSGGIVKTCGSACHALLPPAVLLSTLIFATVLAVVSPGAASGAAGLQESSGDEFRGGSQSVSAPPINRSRGEHHDRYLHLRHLLHPRRLRLLRPRRRLGRLLGQAGPRVARPPPRPVRPRAANGLRRQHVPAIRGDAGLEHRGVRGP
jgi:hypothetical protein